MSKLSELSRTFKRAIYNFMPPEHQMDFLLRHGIPLSPDQKTALDFSIATMRAPEPEPESLLARYLATLEKQNSSPEQGSEPTSTNGPSIEGFLAYQSSEQYEELRSGGNGATISSLRKSGKSEQEITEYFQNKRIYGYLRSVQERPTDVSAVAGAAMAVQEAELSTQAQELKRALQTRKELTETETVSGLKTLELYAAELRDLGGIEIKTELGVSGDFDQRFSETLYSVMPIRRFACMAEIGKNQQRYGVQSENGKDYSLVFGDNGRDVSSSDDLGANSIEKAIRAMSMAVGKEYPERAGEIDIVTSQFLSQPKVPDTAVDTKFVDSLQSVNTDGSGIRQLAGHILRDTLVTRAPSPPLVRPIDWSFNR